MNSPTNAASPHDENPYRSPAVEGTVATPPPTSADLIRREHLNHETSIKTMGTLYLLGTGVGLIWGVERVAGFFPGQGPVLSTVPDFLIALLIILSGVTSIGLRLLLPWARGFAIVISGITIIVGVYASRTVGLIIPGYVLYLLLSKKGQTVFSAEYRQVIRQTSHVRAKTSLVTWSVLALLLIGLVVFLSRCIIVLLS